MMKECSPGVNILTLSKYYCFWVFLPRVLIKKGWVPKVVAKWRRFLVPCLVRVFSECENEVEMMIFVAWSLLRVSCQNEQCFWVVLAPKMLIKQPTLKSRRVPKPRNDNISGNGFLQHIFWCRGHIFLGVMCIDEKSSVLSLNVGKGRVYREESQYQLGFSQGHTRIWVQS